MGELSETNNNSELVNNYYCSHLLYSLEQLPMFFYGTKKTLGDLFGKIIGSKGGYKIFEVTDNIEGDLINRYIKISCDASVGLPTSADQDVYIAAMHLIMDQYIKNKYGFTRQVQLNAADLIKILKYKRSGKVNKDLELSFQRLSGLRLWQAHYLKTKQENGEKIPFQIDENKDFSIFTKFEKTYVKNRNGQEVLVFRLELAEWVYEDIITGYTTGLNLELYFNLTKGRCRRIYRFIDTGRHNKSNFIAFNKLESVLTLIDMEVKVRNKKIKECLKELKDKGYLDKFEFCQTGIKVVYSKKKIANQFQTKDGYITKQKKVIKLTDLERKLAYELAKKCENLEELGVFEEIFSEYTAESIHITERNCVEEMFFHGIKNNKTALFIDLLKKYGHKKVK